jgi:hypothetical protein
LILKPIQALGSEPRSSTRDAVRRAIESGGDVDVLHTLGRVQDHARALHCPKRQRDRARTTLKLSPLLGGELDHVRAGPRHDT